MAMYRMGCARLVPFPIGWTLIQPKEPVSSVKLGPNSMRHQAHNHTDRRIFYNDPLEARYDARSRRRRQMQKKQTKHCF